MEKTLLASGKRFSFHQRAGHLGHHLLCFPLQADSKIR
jgi:hypothetical protein